MSTTIEPGGRPAAFRIRPIRPEDNPAVARIIRDVMTEFGAVGCGYSSQDPEVDAMFEAYPPPRSAFFVVVPSEGKLDEGKLGEGVLYEDVLGCGGMGPLAGGADNVCELRKMYFKPELRGSGMGSRLMTAILDAARTAGYAVCYLETLENMGQARNLYEKFGFKPEAQALGCTGHTGCNRFMSLAL